MENTVKQHTPSHISMRRNFFEGMSNPTPTLQQINILKQMARVTKPTLCIEVDRALDILHRMELDRYNYDPESGYLYTQSVRPVCRIRLFDIAGVAQVDIFEDGVTHLRTHLDKRGNYILEYLSDGKC